MKNKNVGGFKYLLTGMVLLCHFTLTAQQEGINYGQVTRDELSRTVYTLDSTADAVILYDYGYTYFTYEESRGIVINTDYHIKKRLLSENATNLGIVDLIYRQPDNKSKESIDFFRGRTYRLNGGSMTFTEVSPQDIFDTKIGSDYYNKKITFPNVTADCIIEYAYTVSTPMTVRDKPRPWYFQGKYPVIYSEYTIGFPAFLGYNLLMTGYLNIEIQKPEKRNINLGHSQLDGTGQFQKFILRDVPAFTDEPYISSKENFVSKISFELIQTRLPGSNFRDFSTTWEAINTTLLTSDYFGKIILRKTGFLKEEVNRFIGVADPKERLKAAYKAWNGSFKIDDNQGSVFIKNEQKKVLENKTGTPNQVNGLFISLLLELDLDVTPVILSRRSNGAVNREFPMLDSFDYLIAKVDIGGESFLVDITDKANPLGVLPFDCLNMSGFEVKKGGGSFVDIVPRAKYWETMTFTTEFDLENRQVKGRADRNFLGYSGIEQRQNYYAKEANYRSDLLKELGSNTIEELDIRNMEDSDMPLTLHYTYHYEDPELEDPDFIYFNPMLSEQLTKNPFTLEQRLYPVDFGWAYEDILSHTIRLPDGYTVESLPRSEAYALPDNSARFTYQVSVDEAQNTVQVLARTIIRNPVYYAEDYEGLKALFGYKVRKGNEQIVLRKK